MEYLLMILIDTDILIDYARGIEKTKKFLENSQKEKALCISSITHMELIVGCRNIQEQKNLDSFLNKYEEIQPDVIIIEQAIELLKSYRLSHGLLIPDSIIASTSISEDIPLTSKNVKDYQFIAELNFIPYQQKD